MSGPMAQLLGQVEDLTDERSHGCGDSLEGLESIDIHGQHDIPSVVLRSEFGADIVAPLSLNDMIPPAEAVVQVLDDGFVSLSLVRRKQPDGKLQQRYIARIFKQVAKSVSDTEEEEHLLKREDNRREQTAS